MFLVFRVAVGPNSRTRTGLKGPTPQREPDLGFLTERGKDFAPDRTNWGGSFVGVTGA